MKMDRATQDNDDLDCPAFFRFRARLSRHLKAAKSGFWTFLDVPEEVSERLRGMTKVEGTLNGQQCRATLTPQASGRYWLRVNKAMRKGAGADVGDMVSLAIMGPEPEPTVPDDLRAAFSISPKAKTLWEDLTIIGRRDWIR